MTKRKALQISRTTSSQKLSPVLQFAVVFIIVAALALAYYVGTMR